MIKLIQIAKLTNEKCNDTIAKLTNEKMFVRIIDISPKDCYTYERAEI